MRARQLRLKMPGAEGRKETKGTDRDDAMEDRAIVVASLGELEEILAGLERQGRGKGQAAAERDKERDAAETVPHPIISKG